MNPIIGIIGGAGPFAGLDLQHKILTQTQATTDQEHLTIINWSEPAAIMDRTAYLLGETATNPGYAIAAQALQLERMGATVAAIPCNTAHAPPIFDVILAELEAAGSQLQFLHMIWETVYFVKERWPNLRQVGLLATTGTVRSCVYQAVFDKVGMQVIVPPDNMQEVVHTAVYHPHYGIKATGKPAPQAIDHLHKGATQLRQLGAEAIILGCTEMPLAITDSHLVELPVIDPTLVLARALIKAVAPHKLRPLP
ncbi:MAG: amino acid racemase [Chloroflexi bacterium]|nr:MAG: amino acid racemase [Chloroflexota bacterium]